MPQLDEPRRNSYVRSGERDFDGAPFYNSAGASIDNVIDVQALRRARVARDRMPEWLQEGQVEPDRMREQARAAKNARTVARPAAAKDRSVAAERKRVKAAPCHFGLYLLTCVLTAFSVIFVWSASTAIALDHHGRADFFLWRQLGFVAAGLLAMLAASRLPAEQIRKTMWVLYGVALLGLLLTDFTPLGAKLGDTRRWLKLGPVLLQFSELAKIALVGVLADFWSRAARRSRERLWPWAVSLSLSGLLMVLVFIQPHLSAASLLLVLPFCIGCYAGAPWRQIGRIVLPLVLLVVVGIGACKTGHVPFLKPYQRERIVKRFFEHDSDARGGNYQPLEGQRALIRGGLFGTGPGGSLFKQGHLPAPHTDFILAVIGEEWGLAGMLTLLVSYALIIFFCFQIGHGASSSFEALLCAGMGTLLAVQLVCNAGVVTGVMPVTGMPLPLLSYGGSGLICSLAGIGLVLGVSRQASVAAAAAAAELQEEAAVEAPRLPLAAAGPTRGWSY